jgi:hypothetical protein
MLGGRKVGCNGGTSFGLLLWGILVLNCLNSNSAHSSPRPVISSQQVAWATGSHLQRQGTDQEHRLA